MNTKTYKQAFVVLAVSIFIVPQIAFAAWWNPISWNMWNVFRPTQKVQQVQIATTTPATHTATTTPSAKKSEVIQKTEIKSPLQKPAQNQPVTTKENNISQTPTVPTPVVATWSDLESKYFAEATQKGWADLTITNSTGVQHFYRSENGVWVQKNTLAGAQQSYQAPLSPATVTQLAGIALLCSTATSQGNSLVIQGCTDGTILNGYNTNAAFRSNIDNVIQKLQQKQASVAQQQANCSAFLGTPYDPLVSTATNLQNSQAATANYQACITGTAAAWQQAGQQNQTNYQLSQLQDSVNANAAAIQKQQQELQAQKEAQQQATYQAQQLQLQQRQAQYQRCLSANAGPITNPYAAPCTY